MAVDAPVLKQRVELLIAPRAAIKNKEVFQNSVTLMVFLTHKKRCFENEREGIENLC